MSIKIHFGTILECIGSAAVVALNKTSISWVPYAIIFIGAAIAFWGYIELQTKIELLEKHVQIQKALICMQYVKMSDEIPDETCRKVIDYMKLNNDAVVCHKERMDEDDTK